MTTHGEDTVERAARPPRRVALVSDVHANLPAFEAVLADIERAGVDETWCLGDLVGYGAEPDECVALAAERCAVCLVGNHDLVVLGRLDISTFSSNAAAAARWTREHIGTEALDYLGGLAPADTAGPVGLFHASPRDPIWEYVLSTVQADDCMDTMETRVGVVGHSHVALCFWRVDGGGAAEGRQTPAGAEADLSSGEWILNPGGVGQPRDGDPRAAWLLLALETWTATWHRTDYPIDDAALAIERAGLPAVLGRRLFAGQ